ncbi:Peroxygenase 1 [Lecanora helva]
MASQTVASKPSIRFATEKDVSTILALIHELAAYEKATSSVLATERTLVDTLSFPSNPSKGYAKTLLIFAPAVTASPAAAEAPTEEECAGMALYFTNYSTWRAAPGMYLEDLFIRPEYRGRGYGTLLLKELAKETKRIGGERLEWSVLKWNDPSIKFYESVGAKRMEEWVGMRVDDDALTKMAK